MYTAILGFLISTPINVCIQLEGSPTFCSAWIWEELVFTQRPMRCQTKPALNATRYQVHTALSMRLMDSVVQDSSKSLALEGYNNTLHCRLGTPHRCSMHWFDHKPYQHCSICVWLWPMEKLTGDIPGRYYQSLNEDVSTYILYCMLVQLEGECSFPTTGHSKQQCAISQKCLPPTWESSA